MVIRQRGIQLTALLICLTAHSIALFGLPKFNAFWMQKRPLSPIPTMLSVQFISAPTKPHTKPIPPTPQAHIAIPDVLKHVTAEKKIAHKKNHGTNKISRTSSVKKSSPTPAKKISQPQILTQAPSSTPSAHTAQEEFATTNSSDSSSKLNDATPIFEEKKEQLIPPPSVPQTTSLSYEISSGESQGEATYNMWHDGKKYRIQMESKGKGSVGFFNLSQTMQSEGRIEADGLHPELFSIKKAATENPSEIVFSDTSIRLQDGSTVNLPTEGHTLDPLSMLLQFYFTPSLDSKRVFSQITPQGMEIYRFERVATEELQINGHPVETEVWVRHNEQGHLQLKLWLAPKLYYIPIQIHDYKEERTLRLQRINNADIIQI